MNHTARSQTCQFLASYTLYSLGAPVCTNVGEHLAATGQQLAEEHCHGIACIVFGSNNISLADTVPVEGAAKQSLGEVTVGLPVGPLTLSLETCRNSIVADSLFLEAHLAELGIAQHQVANDEGHLHYKFPVGILACTVLLLLGTVFVPTLVHLTVFLCPSHSLGILLVVVDTLFHAAEDFCLVHALVAHAQIFLEEVLVDDTACNTHALATYRQVALATHSCNCQGGTCPTQNLLLYISRNSVVCQILNVMAIDAECRQTLLCMTSQYGSQIYSTGTFCTVEAPNSLWPVGMHVHGLRTIAPARCNGDGGTYALTLELSLASGSFCHTADCAVGNNALNGSTVGMLHVG